jgi:hypothetical protein
MREFSIATDTSIISTNPHRKPIPVACLYAGAETSCLEPSAYGGHLYLSVLRWLFTLLPSRWNYMYLQCVGRILPDCMASHPVIQDSSSGIHFVTSGWEITAFLPAFLDAWSIIVYGVSFHNSLFNSKSLSLVWKLGSCWINLQLYLYSNSHHQSQPPSQLLPVNIFISSFFNSHFRINFQPTQTSNVSRSYLSFRFKIKMYVYNCNFIHACYMILLDSTFFVLMILLCEE